MSPANDHTTTIGTAAGTALAFAYNITSADLIKTIVLSALGAIVGFAVTKFCTWAYKKLF
jgi:hypothetical protein